MSIDLEAVPENVKEYISSLTEENQRLTEEVLLLKDRLYGAKSEKLSKKDKEQALLFNEAEDGLEDDKAVSNKAVKTKVKEHERKKPGRKPLSKDLPRKEIVHDIPEEEKICSCGHQLSQIGRVESEELEIIPEKVIVNKHIRLKYACKSCEGLHDEETPAVKIAPAPRRLIPGSIATPSLLAYVITRKFVDGIPFYRLESIFSRIGAEISRASMCLWAVKVHLKLNRFLKLLFLECRAGPLIGIDETRLQVLKEKGRAATLMSYMWVMRLVNGKKKAVLFRYRKSRHGKFLKRLLKGYHGTVQTDAFSGYNFLDYNDNITHAGCWAHVRRKFIDLSKSSSKAKVANIGIRLIGKLYEIENEIRGNQMSPEETLKIRQEKSKPITDEIKAFLDSKAATTLPKSPLGKAVHYALNRWQLLIEFLENGSIPIDNNGVENAIRPFVIGRKNWLFSDTIRGARASSALYSIIETAKVNGHEPYWYCKRSILCTLTFISNRVKTRHEKREIKLAGTY